MYLLVGPDWKHSTWLCWILGKDRRKKAGGLWTHDLKLKGQGSLRCATTFNHCPFGLVRKILADQNTTWPVLPPTSWWSRIIIFWFKVFGHANAKKWILSVRMQIWFKNLICNLREVQQRPIGYQVMRTCEDNSNLILCSKKRLKTIKRFVLTSKCGLCGRREASDGAKIPKPTLQGWG